MNTLLGWEIYMADVACRANWTLGLILLTCPALLLVWNSSNMLRLRFIINIFLSAFNHTCM